MEEAARTDELQLVERLLQAHDILMNEVGKIIYGQKDALELILISLLCRGHILLLGLPGLGKTLMASTISRALDLEFCRIQFTPDLMPADITGTDIIDENPETGRRTREFLPGPVFANMILADEINRTPPKTQAALLQAMQEHEVTVGRKTYELPPPFMVIATQNPIEMEGTYVLPEAQLDRFMFCVKIAYPSPEEEASIVKGTTTNAIADISQVMGAEELLQLQRIVRGVPVADDVVDYAVRLVGASRPGFSDYTPEHVQNYATVGASPRASQYLILGAKARALLANRYHVNFDDVRAMAAPVLRHRIVLNFRSRADRIDADGLVAEILDSVPTELS
ncbi:MAG: MoxR family ATPase [Victivallales bacterium]|jgi:MoxR-like ATPase|nr:MoxR family ATPase [Victivallales bacterium]MBT7163340.1 MoxR family ATPase [Victivallales bacterium]MBT7301678.1 MoxR family ATPase [Victivallales bacterium]